MSLPRLKVRLDSISAPVMCRMCENAPCVALAPWGALTMGEQVVQTTCPVVLAVRVASACATF